MENLLLTATSLGLSARPITDFRRDKVIKGTLKIPKTYEIGLIMSIGYAQDENLSKQRNRLFLNKIMHGNFYENKECLLNDSLNLNKMKKFSY